ncbi:MAG: hypothetical protein K0S32_3245 [Bacteroidetes bacterium]|jgi:hypothetical protein|nr:hypothetical protein [Bacteroidota bacterium]
MAYSYELAGAILFESPQQCDEAIAFIKPQIGDDAHIFEGLMTDSRMSPHFIFFDWEGSMPASTWQSLDLAFSIFSERCIFISVSGSMDFGEDKEFMDWDFGIKGYSELIYPSPSITKTMSWFPIKEGNFYKFRHAGRKMTEEFTFKKTRIDEKEFYQMEPAFRLLFDDALFTFENNSVFVIFRSVLRSFFNGSFEKTEHSKQLLFSSDIKPGFINVVHSYSSGDFYALYAEGYDNIETVEGNLKCLKIRLDLCGMCAKKLPKQFPWQSAPWGDYIKDTSFIWLAEGKGLVKFSNEEDGITLLLEKSSVSI